MRAFGLAGVCILIVYGSLYPFRFVAPPDAGAALLAMFESAGLASSRGDMLGNLALFVPFGLVAVAGLPSLRGGRIAGLLTVAFVVAAGAQVAQIYVPGRFASVADIVWNMVGAVLGMGAGRMATRLRLPEGYRRGRGALLAGGILLAWLAATLVPFVPSTSLQNVRTSLRPLLQPSLAAGDLLFHLAGALAAGLALRLLAPQQYVRPALGAMVLLVLAARAVVWESQVTPGLVGGLLVGLWANVALERIRPTRHAGLLVLLCLLAISVRALEPFVLRDDAVAIQWLPFAGWLQQSMIANVKSLFASLFLYGALLGMVAIGGGHVLGTTAVLTGWVCVLEIAQMWVADRTPDLTEPLLVAMVGLIVRSLRPGRRENTLAASVQPAPAAEPAPIAPGTWLAIGTVLILGGASAIALALRLPRLPYNVVELFHSDGAFPFLAIFVTAILWTGAAGVWLATRVAASRHPWLAWPTISFVAALVLLALLSASVTQESIGDIAGSNNLYYQVTGNVIWGEAWQTVFLWIGSATPVAIIERPVRFAALLGPLFTGLALSWLVCAHAAGNGPDRRIIARVALWSLPWLFACKAIAFDWSSTDNLNELIARDGPWHIGGGGYLYLLLALVCTNAVLLARIRAGAVDTALRIGTTLLLPGLTFSLLNMGLDQAVSKYSSVFSGVQFLLGPDRRQLLDPAELGLRWAVVQIGVTTMLAVGLRLAATFPYRRNRPVPSTAEPANPPAVGRRRGKVKLARHADMTPP